MNPLKDLLCLMQKRFLKTSAIVSNHSPPSPSPFTVQFLVKSCGFPLETALSTSQNLQLEEKHSQKYESVVKFLKSHGFSDTHLVKLISKRPVIFQSRIDKKLNPKFQYLIGNGFVGSLLPEFILANPDVLRRSLNSQIKPSIDFLKKYLHTDKEVVAAIMRGSWLLTSVLKGTMQQNTEFLLSEEVPVDNISKLLLMQPRVILQKVDRVVSVVNAVKELGLKTDSAMFLQTFRVMISMSDSTWKRKMGFFKSLGWSEEEIVSVLKRDPHCIACSEEKVRTAVDFYVNTLELEQELIIRYPKLLKYSINKRVLPRYNLFKFLVSKKLIRLHKKFPQEHRKSGEGFLKNDESKSQNQVSNSIKLNKKFIQALLLPEESFLENYVNKYENQVPNLIQFYCSTAKV